MAKTRRPVGEHNVLATFDGLEPARDAMLSLERHGLDANDYELIADTGPAPIGRHAAAEDLRISGDAVKHFSGAGVIGALVGAGIVIGVMYAIGFGSLQVAADIGGGIGGAMVGFFLAGLWNVFGSTAVNADVWETYLPEGVDSAAVAVHVSDGGKAEQALHVLAGHHPSTLERFGPDGRRIAA